MAPPAEAPAPPSVFRCAECGDGARLRAWVHLNAYGPVGAAGKIERYDYESEDAHEIIEESVTCRIHGEDFIEKLVNGQYASTMVNGRYVADRGTATPSLPGISCLSWRARGEQARDAHSSSSSGASGPRSSRMAPGARSGRMKL
jgi:hypothetical protein